MFTIKNSSGNITKIFAETFESSAFDQVKNLSNHPAYQESKIRIMPDGHAGAGCTIGTTMTITESGVAPNLVGVDIGCGMLTVRLGKELPISLEEIDKNIRKYVPSGFSVNEYPLEEFDFSGLKCKSSVDISRAELALGSLGGGNHFIEISLDDATGEYYLIIHSGSRKFGNDICKHYQKLASEGKNLKGTSKDLEPLTGEDLKDYLNDMKIAQSYASENRNVIARTILSKCSLKNHGSFETVHNYIDFKRMILRKGAVSAEKDELLLIPMNMRDGSLLCRGLGNEDWNFSAPHGAGRKLSRSKAKEVLTMDSFKESMKDIFTTSVKESTLDESPDAYKDSEEILNSIVGTSVELIGRLKPVYNFKAS